MAVLRFVALGIGAVAQIYAARQLGPEKLGISGMALAAVAQGGILVTLGANTLLVREYKEASCATQRKALVETAYSFRAITSGLLVLPFIVSLPWLWHSPQYFIAAACVLPLIFFESNQAIWVLQAEERVPAQYWANVAGALVSSLLIFAFLTPASPAGSDMLAGVVGTGVCFWISWRYALNSLPEWRNSMQSFRNFFVRSRWLFLSAIIMYVYMRLDQPMVGWLRSAEELGLYRSAWHVANALQPFLLIFTLLLYPRLIAWNAESPQVSWNRQVRLFLLVGPACGFIASLGFVVIPPLYPMLFGDVFAVAAIPCALVVTSRLIAVVNGIFAYGLWAANRDLTMVSIMASVAVISFGLNLLLIPRGGILAAATVNVFSELAILGGSAFCMRQAAAMHANKAQH